LKAIRSIFSSYGLSSGEQYLGLAQMVDDLLDGKSLPGHLVTPFLQGSRRSDSLTKHLDPVIGMVFDRRGAKGPD
jgi:hypothetical protein